MKTRFLCTVLCCILACTVSAQQNQRYRLNDSDQQSIQRAAIDKVNRFQTSCAYIANKSNSREQKRYQIETTLQDFQKGAMITVTSLSGRPNKPKLVETYLRNLSTLNYASIKITWAECNITDEFEYDANTGMYVGWAKLKQTFNAETWERLTVGDVVERTVKIYAKRKNTYEGERVRKKWIIQLGDITARNIEQKKN